MIRPNCLLVVCSLTIATVALAGCIGDVVQQAQTAAKRKVVFEDLKQLGLVRFNFHDQNRRFPKSWEELQSAGLPASVRQNLESEGYTIVLGMSFPEMTGGTSNFIHAFPRDAAQNGGTVGLADGAVMQVTAAEFQEKWAAQQSSMTNAIIIEAPAGGSASGSAGGGAPPPPPAGGGSAPPPPPG